MRRRIARLFRNFFPKTQQPTTESRTWDVLAVSAAKSNLLDHFGKLNAEFQFEPLDLDPKALPDPALKRARAKSQKRASTEKTTNATTTEIASTKPKAKPKPKTSRTSEVPEKPAGDLKP